jgi:hypothetical protein
MNSIILWDMTPCSLLKVNYYFDPEDGGDMFLRNVGCVSTYYTASHPRRSYSSNFQLVCLTTVCCYLVRFLTDAFPASPLWSVGWCNNRRIGKGKKWSRPDRNILVSAWEGLRNTTKYLSQYNRYLVQESYPKPLDYKPVRCTLLFCTSYFIG